MMTHPSRPHPLRLGQPETPTRHHAYDPALPVPFAAAITALSPALWERFEGFGYSGGLDCTRVAPAWAAALTAVGVSVEILRAGGLPGYPSDRGGYLRDGDIAPWAHAWLAIGSGLWLFDPTWSQFRRSGAPTLERYRAPGGASFLDWRNQALATRSPARR